MQGWHYGKGQIYYRSIFRLKKLAFLRARAIPRENFNSWQKSFTLESLIKSDDGDDNENGNKTTGLIRKNNNSARASRFFVHFFLPSLHESGSFHVFSFFLFFGGHEHETTTFFLFSWTSI